MQCYVYRSSIKEGLYVFLPEPDIDSLPDAVRKQLGEPELALTFELTANRTLGSEDPATVLANLQQHGFHIQMPQNTEAVIRSMLNNRND